MVKETFTVTKADGSSTTYSSTSDAGAITLSDADFAIAQALNRVAESLNALRGRLK